MHSFFLLLAVPAMIWASAEGRPGLRGFLLWLLLLAVVVVREVARAIAAAAYGLDLKMILLLPTGGLQSYSTPEGEARAGERKVRLGMALVGPVTSGLLALMLAGLVLTVAPAVNLLGSPWISPAHLVRALVWLNVFVAALNLLPAWPLDGGRASGGLVIARPGTGREAKDTKLAARAMLRLNAIKSAGFLIALSLIVTGVVIHNWWMMMGGVFVLLGSQVQRRGLVPRGQANATTVGEVMLTDYSVLPASATLEDAMEHARHSLQDVFPVVRAGNMVGAVGRQAIIDALSTTGNGYVQGVMTRSFQTSGAADSLMETLDRAMAQSGAALQIVPVLEGEAVIGILTPQHLQRSLGLRPAAEPAARRKQDEQE